MAYYPDFRAIPGSKRIIFIPEKMVNRFADVLQAGAGCEVGTPSQRNVGDALGPPMSCKVVDPCRENIVLVDKEAWSNWGEPQTHELLVRLCLDFYFKLFFDIKVKHHMVAAPYHILTGLRILKKQPQKMKDAVIFYVRTGQCSGLVLLKAHHECLGLSLLASNTMSDREFAIKQIKKWRDNSKFGDNSLRSETWKPGQVKELSFTFSLSKAEIQGFQEVPYSPPSFSCHT